MEPEDLKELLCQALETEKGGVRVYETALRCVENEELRGEWERYLAETREHVAIVEELMDELDIEEELTPGAKVVHAKGAALVEAMESAMGAGDPGVAQLVAAECVCDAELKDHLNWELIGECAKHMKGPEGKALKHAYGKVEQQEDEHFYHTLGWARELWIESLGMKAVLPPPEERRDVTTAIAAARAKQQRGRMARHAHH
jgi:rubrerythrin